MKNIFLKIIELKFLLPSSFSAYIPLSVCIKTKQVTGSYLIGDHIDPPLYDSFALVISEDVKFGGT